MIKKLALAFVCASMPWFLPSAYAQSSYADFDDCPCKYIGVPLSSAEYGDPVKLAALIDGKARKYLLLDVRSRPEYLEGHIPTAVNMPVDELLLTENLAMEKDTLVIVYCVSGKRSARAADYLKSHEFTDVVDFGGISRWPGVLTDKESAFPISP